MPRVISYGNASGIKIKKNFFHFLRCRRRRRRSATRRRRQKTSRRNSEKAFPIVPLLSLYRGYYTHEANPNPNCIRFGLLFLWSFHLSANAPESKVSLFLRKVSAAPSDSRRRRRMEREGRKVDGNRFAPMKAEIDIAHDIVPTARRAPKGGKRREGREVGRGCR